MKFSTVLRVHAFLFWALAAHYSASGAELHQRSHVAVNGGIVRLGDVVTCTNCAESISTPLMKIALMPSPTGEKSLRLSRQDLLQLLVLNDIELRDWRIDGAEQTIIVRPKEQVAAVTPKEAPKAEVAPVAAAAEVAPAPIAAAPVPVAAPAPLGRVVAALRPISKGEIVKPSDVELIPAQDEKTLARAYQDLGEVVGKEAKRLIPANWPVDSSHVQPPQLVKRGEVVTIRAKAAGVTVTVSGVAKTDGAAGEVVSVVPEGSKEQILACVTGLRTLEVFASGPRY